MNNLYENLLSFLEKISDESFWHAIFGERALNLLKRYFGSDVVFLGFIVYLAPIIGYHLSSLFYYVLHTIRENMYVSIQISKDQSCYEAIQQFVVKNTAQLKHLRDVEGRCIYDDEDDDDIQGPSPPPRLGLFPLDETVQKIYYKKHTLWVSKLKNGGVQKNNDNYYSNNIKDLLGMMNTNPCIQITMRGQNMELLKSFVQEWINKHYENEHGKLTIYKCMPTRYDGFEWNSIGSKELRPFSSVILKDRQKERILKDIQTFRRREHWYSIRGIPYRRGYLLYGPPGTGKTSLVQSVASKINMNVAIISLSGKMDDENFNVMLQEVPRNSILVMEDIDHCVIQDPNSGEEHAAAQAKITMSGLLNALDGVVAQEGSMVFMTCNDLTRIQPALLRPGRIDMKMELGYADKTQIRKMFWRFMGEDDMEEGEEEEGKDTKKIMASPELKDLADQFTDMIPDLEVTPAELQNFFIMHLMDKEAEKEDDEDKEEQDTKVDYSYLLDAVPAFLETVRYDRQQALEHKMNRTSLTVKNLQAQLQDQKSLAEEDTKTVVEETAVSEPVK
ncbi:P-loop containing nucleoside triphosphate hydrolase protein [Gilbertella persicaria]|uniref:P-loop containing nucleoside triphosphate hydrolase protein n=1 Tax=Gilbertella persicaria TaxID=101096 RepID=UPI00221FEF06|nr:P-loop containing nucleoside triphosphate hydrolase protein [Gilbertella persicaria]KAI8048757.1 P-loop containing nucleoside triphosphate hydrolase protein [Gilbertella persicaria]